MSRFKRKQRKGNLLLQRGADLTVTSSGKSLIDPAIKNWKNSWNEDSDSRWSIESPKLGTHLLGTRAKVANAFSLRSLRWHLLARIEDYYPEGEVVNTAVGVYVYKDNGCDVLAVAHLDSVAVEKEVAIVTEHGHTHYYARTVDDRAGAYVILDLLPKLGVKTDILLTEGEESMMSTAMYFTTKKKYKWVFEFDRNGTDVVMYQYETEEHKKELEKYGFKVGDGSFSDIACLDDLEVTGFNFGTGYYLNHTDKAHVKLDRLLDNVTRFLPFYEANKDVEMPYTETAHSKYVSVSSYSVGAKDILCKCGKTLWGTYLGEYRSCWTCNSLWYLTLAGKIIQVRNYCPHCKSDGSLTREYTAGTRNWFKCKTCGDKAYRMHYTEQNVDKEGHHFFLYDKDHAPPAGSENVEQKKVETPKQLDLPINTLEDAYQRAQRPSVVVVDDNYKIAACDGCSQLVGLARYEIATVAGDVIWLCEACSEDLLEVCPYCYANLMVQQAHDFCPSCFSDLIDCN